MFSPTIDTLLRTSDYSSNCHEKRINDISSGYYSSYLFSNKYSTISLSAGSHITSSRELSTSHRADLCSRSSNSPTKLYTDNSA